MTARRLQGEGASRHWGVELAAHVFIPNLHKRELLGLILDLPTAGGRFELIGTLLPSLSSVTLPPRNGSWHR